MDVLCEKIVDFHREPIPLNINIDINKIKISHNKRNSISLDVKKWNVMDQRNENDIQFNSPILYNPTKHVRNMHDSYKPKWKRNFHNG